MTIYVRTARGDQLMRSRESAIPRRVKSILISIDGKTDSTLFISSLSSFGNVSELLLLLKKTGLIRSMSELDSNADMDLSTGNAEFDQTSHDWQLLLRSGANETLLQDLPVRKGLTAVQPDGLTDTKALVQTVKSFVTPSTPTSDPLPAAKSLAQHQTWQAISLMTDFVNMHLPEQAMELLFAIEQLNDRDNLLASLEGYAKLIAPAGSAASTHLQAVNAALRTA